MKLDDDQNGLARVDPTASNTPVPRRAVPMKRGDRPTTEDLTPAALGGTSKVRTELETVLIPIFEQMASNEQNAAWDVVNRLIPEAIARRSAQTELRIASNVRSYAGEVASESLATFQGISSSNSAQLSNMADSLLNELCPV